MLYATAVADSAHGICTQPLHADAWSGVSGASEAPKSTCRLEIAEMPAPEPTGLYCSVYPNAEPTAGVHTETSGETNVLPAPVIVVSLLFAPAAAAISRPSAVAAMRASPLFIDVLSLFRFQGVSCLTAPTLPRIGAHVG